MELGLGGKAAVVAGASRGIGRAIAHALLQEGCRVSIAARGGEDLAAVGEAFRVEFGSARVTTSATDATTAAGVALLLAEAQKAFGAINIVIANVGRGSYPAGHDRPVEEWNDALSTNLLGAMELVAQSVSAMEKNTDGGAIVLVGSIAGVEDIGAPLPYAVAKAGLLAATKVLARRVAPRVRVNAVAPGNVLFPGGSWERKLTERREEVESMIRSRVPLQRFARPEEVAAAVVFLASGASSFTTGSCLVVDGGQTHAW